MKKTLVVLISVFVLAALGFAAQGKIAPLSWGLWGEVNLDRGVAVGGYDVVSYHAQGAATPGVERYKSEYNGAQWLFSSRENKALFDTHPERFVPQYGGFCAYAVFNDVTADVNPTVWHIENGRLYLFASEDPKQAWIAKISEGVIKGSDQNWAQR